MWCLYGVGRRHSNRQLLIPAAWAEGKEIRTLEGEAKGGNFLMFSRLMRNPAQCSAGFVAWPDYGYHGNAGETTREAINITEIRRGLAGNLCRCTGYQRL